MSTEGHAVTHRPHHRPRPLAAALAALVATASVLTGLAAPAPAQSEPVVVLEGYGWGHGRGMSQHGALGYAVDHGWDWRRILGHYYSNTTEGTLPGTTTITTRLTSAAGQDTIVWRPGGLLRTDATAADQLFQAFLVRPLPGGGYDVYAGSGCGGPWTGPLASTSAGAVRVFAPDPRDDSGDHRQLLGLCQSTGVRFYRGELHAYRDRAQVAQTRNLAQLEHYLRGVVPRESPASWGDLGGGRGMHALRAQAVAARSYAMAEDRDPGRAKTCDTTACQVYSGAFFLAPGATTASSTEDGRTNTAIADTRGVIRLLRGVPARTEFSSSTGGWTAGGTFPAVVDEGDDYAGNRVHTWTEAVKVRAIEAAFPGVGQLTSIEVVSRNGLGRAGGRVLRLALHGTGGTVTTTGNEFRSKLAATGNCTKVGTTHLPQCMKSDWFRILSGPGTEQPVPGTVDVAVTATGGQWVATSGGRVVARRGAPALGSLEGQRLNSPILAVAAHPGGRGFWLVAGDGGIFAFGEARFHGSTGGMRLNRPVVGMAAHPGGGYWMVASDGGIFAYGGAGFFGSTGGTRLNRPVVGMAGTPSGRGYWLVASDGGIFAYGDAGFFGSTGGIRLAEPIIGMAATGSGRGYWLLGRDGGVFAFGDATFHGSLVGHRFSGSVVSIEATPSGRGYWIVTSDGTAHPFGDATTR